MVRKPINKHKSLKTVIEFWTNTRRISQGY